MNVLRLPARFYTGSLIFVTCLAFLVLVLLLAARYIPVVQERAQYFCIAVAVGSIFVTIVVIEAIRRYERQFREANKGYITAACPDTHKIEERPLDDTGLGGTELWCTLDAERPFTVDNTLLKEAAPTGVYHINTSAYTGMGDIDWSELQHITDGYVTDTCTKGEPPLSTQLCEFVRMGEEHAEMDNTVWTSLKPACEALG